MSDWTNHRTFTNQESTLLVQIWDTGDGAESQVHVETAERDSPDHTWGPPTTLDRIPSWIGNLIQRSGPPLPGAEGAEIHLDGGDERELRRAFLSLTWEPGDLTTSELERVLIDALADLWRDSYRQGNPAAQRNIFQERVRNAIKVATGDGGTF